MLVLILKAWFLRVILWMLSTVVFTVVNEVVLVKVL